MPSPTLTFELGVHFLDDAELAGSTKSQVMEWLPTVGIDTYVEGTIDGLDVEHDYARAPESDPFLEFGGALTPLLIYKYEEDVLRELAKQLTDQFGSRLRLAITPISTQEWQEGWKSSFRPISTRRFIVFPPWEEINDSNKLVKICIEPGMAFGTGQHATTILCLEMLDKVWGDLDQTPDVADIGTGTGVLAIAAKKIGARTVLATDIDEDAIAATRENALRNDVDIEAVRDSVPAGEDQKFDLVLANILAVVLERILPDLSRIVKDEGFLLMSGVLEEQASEMIGKAQTQGLQLVSQLESGGWVGLCFQRAAR